MASEVSGAVRRDSRPKVIFLDMDGVLNGHDSIASIRPDCAKRLQLIIDHTGTKIVLTSSWRYWAIATPDNIPAMTGLGFQYMLKTHGIDCEVIGTTPPDEEIPNRGDQIRAWVKANFRPDKYVVLDDGDPEEYGFVPFGGRFIRTKSDRGLQDEDVVCAIGLLQAKEDA